MKQIRSYRALHLVVLSGIALLGLATAQSQTLTTNGVLSGVSTNVEEPEAAITNLNGSAATNETTNASMAENNEPQQRRGHRGDQTIVGQDVEVKPGETVSDVVLIGGSARIRGTARGDVVVIMGDIDVAGQVNGDTVNILGNIRIHTNAVVKGDAVAVMGGVQVQTNASVGGDVVGIGGKTDVANGAKVRGDVVPLNFGVGTYGLPKGIEKWLTQCVLKLRPLSFAVGWVWAFAGVFFLLYLLVAAAFPHPVALCVEQLSRRPASTFFFGLLTKILIPLVITILAITVVGIIVIPFLSAALFLGAIVGKVALLEWFGLKLGCQFNQPALQKPVVGFVLGAVILTLLYLIPVVGFLTFLILSIWGLGCAITTLFSSLRKESPASPGPAAPPARPGLAGPAPVPAWSPSESAGNPSSSAAAAAQQDPFAATGTTATATLPGAAAVAVPEAYNYPRAGFWVRLGAGFLDIVLVILITGIAHGMVLRGPSLFLIFALAYFSGMWTWRGATVGGIVLGLKVVRLDGQQVTFMVALVRALAAAFSIIVFFLGFFWIAWNQEKQGWHDLLSGTVVLQMPRATPLIVI